MFSVKESLISVRGTNSTARGQSLQVGCILQTRGSPACRPQRCTSLGVWRRGACRSPWTAPRPSVPPMRASVARVPTRNPTGQLGLGTAGVGAVVPASAHQGTGIEKGMCACQPINRGFLPGKIGSDVPVHERLALGQGGQPRLHDVPQGYRLPPKDGAWSHRQSNRRCYRRGHFRCQSHSRCPTCRITHSITRASGPVSTPSNRSNILAKAVRHHSSHYGNNMRKRTNYSFCMRHKLY
jgi:hypothetical protein